MPIPYIICVNTKKTTSAISAPAQKQNYNLHSSFIALICYKIYKSGYQWSYTALKTCPAFFEKTAGQINTKTQLTFLDHINTASFKKFHTQTVKGEV